MKLEIYWINFNFQFQDLGKESKVVWGNFYQDFREILKFRLRKFTRLIKIASLWSIFISFVPGSPSLYQIKNCPDSGTFFSDAPGERFSFFNLKLQTCIWNFYLALQMRPSAVFNLLIQTSLPEVFHLALQMRPSAVFNLLIQTSLPEAFYSALQMRASARKIWAELHEKYELVF